MQSALVVVLAVAGWLSVVGNTAHAGPPGYWGVTEQDAWMYWHAQGRPWHDNYKHTAYGRPVSLVVPPTANLQTHYNWGVSGTAMTPIYHQYSRAYPSSFSSGGQMHATPYWPASTDHFGVYYIRAPW
ncbi:MAG: hypothetical protein KDA41_14475 [Planctomycetales bacterium]|nr:hypothetical protein [Planctomycetales bacterium]